MKLNTRPTPLKTHEGATAKHIDAEQQLRRLVMTCMLWEDTFYEDGKSVADRIAELVGHVDPATVASIAIEAREQMKLRHAPLWIVRAMAKADPVYRRKVGDTLAQVIQRPDELTEFLAMYWKDGKTPISKQVKKGLARAFGKFSEYQLAKYNRDDAIKLRDVMFLVHPKPTTKEQEELYKKVVDGTLTTPDTWEVALSSGADKKESWERLIRERKLGAMAFLRNLRNMQAAGVDEHLIREGLSTMQAERVLPYRFIAAARYAPKHEDVLEAAMFKCLSGMPKIPGKTVLLIDVSGSMDQTISAKSDMTRMEAACALAMLARELCNQVAVFTFSFNTVPVPNRRGFALRDAIVHSQSHGGTYLGEAIKKIDANETYDRLIVITDEQSHDKVPDPKGKGYMINVATYQNGVGYGPWVHVDGWSESVLSWIAALEGINLDSGTKED